MLKSRLMPWIKELEGQCAHRISILEDGAPAHVSQFMWSSQNARVASGSCAVDEIS